MPRARTSPAPFPIRPRTRSTQIGPSPADSLIKPPAPAAAGGDLVRRVTRLLLLRTLVVTVVLGLSIWLLAAGRQQAAAAVWFQSGIIAATYLSSIVFGVLLRTGVSPRKVARPMQAADLAVTSLLVYVTGGAQSPYTFLYALSIVSAGAVSYRRGAIGVTLGSIIAVTGTGVLAWLHVVDLPMAAQALPWEQPAGDLVRALGIQLVALTGVGALAYIFGDQLQKGAETIASTRQVAADLLTLHQDIVRSLASGLITTAPDGTIVTVNAAAAEILRKRKSELIGTSIDAGMPGLSALLAAENVTSAGELHRADLTLGELGDLVVGVTVSPLRDPRDQVVGRIVNFQDLTELRQLEADKRRNERLATVGHLAAGIAHELRNPLASISGSIELLRQAPQASEDDRTLMAIVQREIQRLNVLVGDLLDFANPRPRQPVTLDLGLLVRETLQVAERDPAFVAVELTAEIDDDAGRIEVFADPAKLRQVLWNLLRNAADAAGAGGKHVRVAVHASDDTVEIGVADDGEGIPPDRIAKIFDPFFTTKRTGTGLGLATCHAVIAEHGGAIDVRSVVGEGTEMVVTLPRT